MKTILTIMVLILALLPAQSYGVEVTTTGYGGSFAEALQNAKVLATEQASSTFVTGSQELTDGKYSETTKQYNGGYIRRVDVKNTVIDGGLYKVTILADVDTDKVNVVVASSSTSHNTVAVQVERLADEIERTSAMWEAIGKVTDPFVITVDSSKYTIFAGTEVDITYQLHITWNPKWVDDAKQLTKVINRSPLDADTSAVCFNDTPTKAGFCRGVKALPNTTLWQSTPVDIVIQYNSGRTETILTAIAPPVGLFHVGYASIQGPDWFDPVTQVDAVTIYELASAKFSVGVSMSLEKFKSVANVTFVPKWN